MADLFLKVRADYTDAMKCREELRKVEDQLKAVDQNTSPKEIERLTKRYAELTARWENGLSQIGKVGYYAKEVFSKISDAIKGSKEDIKESEEANKNVYSTLVKRLKLEEQLTKEFGKQKEQAEKQLNDAKEGYNRNLDTYQKLQERLDKKYNGQAEGFWSEADQDKMNRGRETLAKWEKEINDRQTQIEVLSTFLDKSQEKVSNLKEKLSNFDMPQLDLKTNIEDLKRQVEDGESSISKMKDTLTKLNDELNERTDFQGAKDKMYAAFSDIEEKKKEMEGLQQTIDNFSIDNLVNHQKALEQQAADVTEKISKEDETIGNLKKQQEGLNEESVMYKNIQDSIDHHMEERERQIQILEQKNNSINRTVEAIEKETKAQTERQQKVKELEKDIQGLSDQYQHYKDIVNDNDANKEAVNGIKNEIIDTKEKIDQTTDSTKALKDVLSQVEEVYKKNEESANNVYKGFVGSDYEKATRVYGNEDEYNRANELALRSDQLQGQIQNGVQKGNITTEELQNLQDELTKTQEEFDKLDGKARETAAMLGGELAQKASVMTTRLFEANKAVNEAEKSYNDLAEELKNAKEALKNLEDNSNDQKSIIEWKTKVDELTEAYNKQSEALATAKAEQKDAQDEINKTSGELGETLQDLKKSEGVFDDLNNAVSMLPVPLQNVVKGIKGVGRAMKNLMKNPLMIFLGGIVLALQALWQWFQKTEEGQRAFAKISGYVGGVLSRLEDIVIAVGGAIFKFGKIAYEAFSNPQKAIVNFAKTIRDYLWNYVSKTGEMFGALGTLIADVFTGNWDDLGKDLDNVKKKAKAAFDSTAVGALVNGVVDLTKKTGNWLSETHKVGLESAKIKQDEIALGDEIEKNREKTLKLQKSMAELQATMRNTSLSKADREKAMQEYKKALEQQAQIQRDFAEKRMSIQKRKMDLSPNDTIEERRTLEHLANDVLQADLNKQQQLTSLQRLENSINKKPTGKSKSRLQEEYSLLLNDQAQQQAKQIRENGYIIEQARINTMRDGTEKTIAQMKLDYRKELDAATEYENDLTRKKLKLARDNFYKNPKNKGKTFDPTSVDVSMTEQEMQVSNAKVNDAKMKYMQRMDALMKPYETMAEKQNQKEKDYQELMNLTSEQILEKSKQIEDLSKDIETGSDEEKEYAKRQIGLLEKEIDLLEQKQRLIKSNHELDSDENKSRWDYLIKYGEAIEQETALREKYLAEIRKLRESGDEWGAKGKENEMYKALSDSKLSNLMKDPEYIKAFEDLGHASSETLNRLIKKFEDAKNAAANNLKPDQLKAYTDAIRQMREELERRDPFGILVSSMKSLFGVSADVKKWEDILKKMGDNDTIEVDGQEMTRAEVQAQLNKARDEEATKMKTLRNAVIACSKTIGDFSNMLTQLGLELGGDIANVAGAIGSAFSSVTSISDLAKNYDANATGLSKIMGQASMVMGTVSAMVSFNQQLDSLLPDQQSLYEHYAKKQREINKKRQHMMELELAQLEERMKMENWFYENSLTQLKKSAEINKKNLEIYGQIAAAPQEAYKDASSGFAKWAPAIAGAIVGIAIGAITLGTGSAAGVAAGTAVAGSIAGAVGGAVTAGILTGALASAVGTVILAGIGSAVANVIRSGIESITYQEGQTAALDNLRVQTQHRTFFRGEKTQDLQSWLKENWNADLYDQDYVKRYGVNIVDPEVVKKVLEEDVTLVGETRETLEDLLEYSEKIHEFLDEIHEYVSSAFSPLVDNLSDALWDWLTDGKDVMDSFRDYAADTFKNIAQDALKAMMSKQIFEPFQEELENLAVAYATGQSINGVQIDEAGYMVGVAKIADEMQQVIETQLPIYQKTAEIMNEAMRNVGIDMTGKSTRQQQSASANSIQNVSYDQADSIIGILLGHTILFEQMKAIMLGMDFDENGLVQQGSISPEVNELTLLNANAELLYTVGMETRDIAADSRDILAGMAIHVEEIRDGMVDTVVPRIKNIDDNLNKVYKLVEAQ